MSLKKIFTGVVCIIICFVFVTPALAGKTYTAGTTNIQITIPDNMYVFTRETSPEDSRILEIGQYYDGMMSRFKLENIYLEAMNVSTYESIVVSSVPTNIKNYYDMSADELNHAVSSENSAVKSGGGFAESVLYKSSSGINYVKTSAISDSASVSYTTVYNGNKITIKYSNYDSEITSGQDSGFKTVVESISMPAKSPSSDKKSEDSTNGNEDQEQPVTDENDDEKTPEESEQNTEESDDISEENDDESNENSQNKAQDNDNENFAESFLSQITAKNLLIVMGALIIFLLLIIIFGKKSENGGRRRR